MFIKLMVNATSSLITLELAPVEVAKLGKMNLMIGSGVLALTYSVQLMG